MQDRIIDRSDDTCNMLACSVHTISVSTFALVSANIPGVAVTLMQGVLPLPSPCCPDEPASFITFINVDCHTSIPYCGRSRY